MCPPLHLGEQKILRMFDGGIGMSLFLTTFGIIALIILMMAVGVIFGRNALKGSCGGLNGGDCPCTKKCDKRLRLESLEAQSRKV